MKPECAATIFQVSNVGLSIQYSTSVLGFALDFRYNDLAGMEYGPVLIYLSGQAQDVKRTVGQGSIYIFCDEVDQYFNDISIKGALIEVPMDDRGYGMRDFAIKDPDSNVLTFGISIEA